MSFIGNLVGANSGDSGGAGMNFNAQGVNPKGEGLIAPTSQEQIQNAYVNNQAALNQQNQFIAGVQGTNSLGNLNALYGQQQGLANQYQGIANGTGPNPAMAQFANTTGQNIQNQGAMMAGQRGANANVGLLARQAAMQGANTQQQAVGQAAALQAQQQLNALSGLQSQQSMMGNQNMNLANLQGGLSNQYVGNTANVQNSLMNALGNYNNSNVTMRSNINNANAGIANTVAQGQQAITGGVMNAIGNGEGMIAGGMGGAKGGLVVQHFDEGGMAESDAPQTSAPNLGINNSGLKGPSIQSFADDYSSVPFQHEAPVSSENALALPPSSAPSLGVDNSGLKGPQAQSFAGNYFSQNNGNIGSSPVAPAQAGQAVFTPQSDNPGAAALYQGMSSMLSMGKNKGQGGSGMPSAGSGSGGGGGFGMSSLMTKFGGGGGGGGGADASAAEDAMAKGGKVDSKKLISQKEKVPGKASVKGDSLKNDTVPAVLSPGEVVIPRSVMNSSDPVANAAKFVQAIMAKQNLKRKNS